ncbi:MAG: AraC family transcriptional regulator [Devosiaceae bacterium]|nr:AraC family transcriptional regulator [Devosiaceae bacterium MH13]
MDESRAMLLAMVDHTHTEPLSAHRLFQTSELDEARAIVADKFCDHRLDIATGPEQFDACHHRAEGHAASLNYIRYGADVLIEPGELQSFYLVQIPLSGAAAIDNRAGEVETHWGGVGSVLNPHHYTKMRWREGCAQLLLQINADALHKEAESLLGAPMNDPVTFETAVDASRPETAQWVRKFKTCFGLAERKAIFSQSEPSAQMWVEKELIADFLRSQPSNISALLAAAPSTAVNAHLRRALKFIQANLQNPISVADIADAAGTTPRSLQLHFRAEFEMSPMRYLRQQRLIFAQRLISHARPDETLGDIAYRAGFTHVGRFSADYREQFGEAPSETRQKLRRA